jgi:neurofibromin 1
MLDCTSFTSSSEIPLQWLKYCIELLPSDIRQQFMAAHILNPNILANKYLRRLHNVSAGLFMPSWPSAYSNATHAGNAFGGDVRTYLSITELREHIPETALAPLVYPGKLVSMLINQGLTWKIISSESGTRTPRTIQRCLDEAPTDAYPHCPDCRC